MAQLNEPAFVPLDRIYWSLGYLGDQGNFYLQIDEVGGLTIGAVWFNEHIAVKIL